MGITAAELDVRVTAETSSAERGLSDFSGRMKRFGDELQGIGMRMSVGITAPLALMGAGILKVGQDYERAMNIFQAVTRASSDEMSRAGQLARQLGADMTLPATSAGDAAKAMTELAKGGLSASQAMAAARGTLQLAAAAGIEEAAAATITANALNSFGLAASEAGRVSDLLAASANASSAEITDVALSMQQASAVFASAHIPVEDLVAAIGLMANAGIKGSDAGTSLKTMLIALEAPTTKAASEMKQLGINIFDSQGQFIPFRAMIEQVSGAMRGMTDQQQAVALKTIFGTDALRAANIVLAEGVDKFDKMSEAVNRTGAAQELSGARAKGLSGAIDGLVSQLETLALQIYQAVGPGLESMTRMLADLVGNLGLADKSVLQAGVTMAAVFAAAGPVAIGIGAIISLIGGPLTLAIVGLTGAVAVLAAEWVLDMNQMNNASTITAQDTKQRFIDLASTIGKVLDAFSFAVNLISGAVKALGGLLLAAWTPMLTGLYIVEYGVSAGLKRMEQQWANMNASYARSTNAMAAAVEGRWSTMLGNLVSGMGAAQRQIARGWGETERLFGFRSKINWEVKADTNDAEKRIKEAMGRIQNTAAAGGEAAGKAFSDPFLNDVKQVMQGIIDAIDKGLGLSVDKIGVIIRDKISPAVEGLKMKTDALRESLDLTGKSITSFSFLAAKVPPILLAGDAAFGAWAKGALEAQKANEAAAKAIESDWQTLSAQFKDLSSELPRAWNTIIDGILTGSGRVGSELLKLGVKIKGFAGDILNVFDALPGKWGQSLNKGLNEVNKWISFIDAAIKLIQRIMGDAQTGLAGVISSVVGVFKSVSGAAQAATAGIAAGAVAGGVAATGMAAATASAAVVSDAAWTQMAVTAQGAAVAIQGAAHKAGDAVDQMGKDAGGGGDDGENGFFSIIGKIGLIAGVAGAVIGLFKSIFGGKSALEKAKEAAALQQAKDAIKLSIDQVLKSAQEVIQAGIETFNKAIAFLFTLDEFTPIRKEKFTQFFDNLQTLMDYFAAQAKNWATDSLAQMKVVAEAFGPVADSIAKLPLVFEGISRHVDIPKKAFGVFFSDLDRLMKHFFDLAAEWGTGTSKQAGKVAEDLAPIINIFSPLIEAIKSMADIERPANSAFKAVFNALERFVSHVGEISDLFDKSVLKAIANFADKVSPAIDLWKGITDGIRGMTDITMPSDASFEAIFSGLEKVVTGMLALADRLSTDSLEKAESIANSSLAMFASIKAGVEAFVALKDFKGVLPEIFGTFLDDFNASVDMLVSMATRGAQFQTVAKTFEDYIIGGAASLAHAFTMLSQIMNAAGAFFPNGSPITVGVTAAGGGGGSLGPLSLGASSGPGSSGLGPLSIGSGKSSSTTTTVNHYHINGVQIVADSPAKQAALEAFIRLFLPGVGLDAVSAQHS